MKFGKYHKIKKHITYYRCVKWLKRNNTTIQAFTSLVVVVIAVVALCSDNRTSRDITERLEATNKIWRSNVQYDVLKSRPKIAVIKPYLSKDIFYIEYKNTGFRDALDLTIQAYAITLADKSMRQKINLTKTDIKYDFTSQDTDNYHFRVCPKKIESDTIVIAVLFCYRDQYINEILTTNYYELLYREGNYYKQKTMIGIEDDIHNIEKYLDIKKNVEFTINEKELYNND